MPVEALAQYRSFDLIYNISRYILMHMVICKEVISSQVDFIVLKTCLHSNKMLELVAT